MATAMTAGKLKHMEKVANQKGVIAAAAMDQRGSLKKSIAKAKGVDPKEISWEQMAEFKTAVTKILTPHASAILLDPEYGIEAAKQRSKNAGLLLAYESSGYDNTGPGRLPILMPTWTVSQLKEAGANAIKILFYYNPFEQKEINETKKAWVERIGVECAYQDIPYFLEFVGYDTKGGEGKDLAFAKQKPEIVKKSMEEFSKDRYHVDVLKVEVPVNLQFTQGTKSFKNEGVAYTKKEAMEHYKASAAVTKKPFIYLSAGVSDEEFRESLTLACESGIKFNGVLCGRATWKDGIPVYAKSGIKALESWLSDRGVQNIQALNAILDKGASSVWDKIKRS
ncbi:MAG: tagatose 1,6-diphosphate aldolase [Deltaproteobacteria bacterium]|nr:tagatose 1,6-diphosphate aldolase [Deltaproteobacteria bacterium]